MFRIWCYGCGNDVAKKKLDTGVLYERYRRWWLTTKQVWLCRVCCADPDKNLDAMREVMR